MAYESTPPHGAGRQKTRSASISAPSSGSLETILNPPPSNGTPDIGYQRRRPATRTQSARITGARSVSQTKIYLQLHSDRKLQKMERMKMTQMKSGRTGLKAQKKEKEQKMN